MVWEPIGSILGLEEGVPSVNELCDLRGSNLCFLSRPGPSQLWDGTSGSLTGLDWALQEIG